MTGTSKAPRFVEARRSIHGEVSATAWGTAAVAGLACFCAYRPAAAAALVAPDRRDAPGVCGPFEAAQVLPHLFLRASPSSQAAAAPMTPAPGGPVPWSALKISADPR
jgi:hypothetical protein